jgi:hypothetical protein
VTSPITDSANFATADTTFSAIGSPTVTVNLAGTGTLTASGTRSVASLFAMVGALTGVASLVKFPSVPVAFGPDPSSGLTVAPVVKLTASTNFASGGTLSAVGSKVLFRDGVTFDGGNAAVDNFPITPPATIKNADYGVLLVSWASQTGDPTTCVASSLDPDGITIHTWDVLVPVQQSNQMCFAIFGRKFVNATDAGIPVTVQLGGSRFITAAAGWWSGVDSVDNIGTVGARAGASSADTLAPGVLTKAVNGETVVQLFAERSPAVGTLATLSEGKQRIFLEGSGSSTCSVLISDVIWPNFGVSDDVTATYNTPSTNGIGVQIALLPLNSSLGFIVPFSAEGILSAAGTDTTKNANLSTEGTLAATGLVVGRAAFSAAGSLQATPIFFGTAALSGSGALVAVGTPSAAVSVALSATGALAAAASPAMAQNASLSGSGALTETGAPTFTVAPILSGFGALAAVTIPTPVIAIGLGGDGALVAAGVPALSTPAAVSATGTLASTAQVAASGSAGLTGAGTLAGAASSVTTSGVLTLSGAGALTAVGIPDFEPVTVVGFSAEGILTASGFRPQIPPALLTHQPYYVRQTQDWAVQQERQRHIQAIYQVGEPALFVLMWKVEDFEAGLVTPCPRCRSEEGDVDARVAAIYQQPQTARCPFCFGTTYDGGVRAKIMRPAIFTDADEDERKSGRGVTHGESTMVETTDDFRSRTGDYVFRRDGSRWQLGHPQRDQLRTGYTHPSQSTHSLGYARIPANREDKASVAFEIPPSAAELSGILTEPLHYPVPTA